MTRRRREWLLKAALVDLGLWVARADGAISREEASRILHLLRHWGTTRTELKQLKSLGEKRVNTPGLPMQTLRSLPRVLSVEQRPVFLEALSEVAFHRQARCSSKVGRLLDVARAMRLEQLEGLRIIEKVLARVGSTTPDPIEEKGLTFADALLELGLDRPDPAAARRAYRRLTLRYHPDRNPSASGLQRDQLVQRLMRVRQAYELVANSLSAAA